LGCFEGLDHQDVQDWTHFKVEGEQLVGLDLGGDVYARFFGDVGGGWGQRFELVRLDLYVCLGLFLAFWVFEEKVQVCLDLWVWGCFYVVGGHFFLVFVEICQLLLHIFIFYSFFFHINVSLFLILDILSS
jgi:hypothetical protein